MAEQTRNAKNYSLRMYVAEHEALLDACDALSTPEANVEPSLLLTTASVEEAARLGFMPSTAGSSVRRKPGTWRNAPPLLDKSFKRRMTITIHPLHFQAIKSAAEWADTEVTRFIFGSMWRFIASCQLTRPKNRKLRAIKVPEKYRGKP